MESYVTVITLAVDDLERAMRFYRDGLGIPTEGIVGEEFENGAVVFFKLQTGLTLALWPRKSLAVDTGLEIAAPISPAVSLGHNVPSRRAVDEIMNRAAEAGARVIKAPQPTFYGGYAGYFQDPDGHLWEIVFNPGFPE
jgi:catechol 2,3-dioxygenase-like lactoylglutathione lyase family enzyme